MKIEDLEAVSNIPDNLMQIIQDKYSDRRCDNQHKAVTELSRKSGEAYDEVLKAIDNYSDAFGVSQFRDGFRCAIIMMKGELEF